MICLWCEGPYHGATTCPTKTHAFPVRAGVEWPDVGLGLVVEAPLDDCYLCQRGECVQTTDDHETILHSRRTP